MKYYFANCTNAFNPDNGECLFRFFNDVSDFAQREEEFHQQVEDGENGYLERETFADFAEIPEFLAEKDLVFYSLEGSEGREEVLIAYDPAEDIHYFFAE